jgi:thymidylate kinase
MIVEFLGSTGVGKSTLAPALVQAFRQEDATALSVTEGIHHYMTQTLLGRAVGVVVPQRLRHPIVWRSFVYVVRPWHVLEFAILRPRLVCHVLASQLRRPIPWHHKWLILRLFLGTTGEYQFLTSHARSDEVLIFDEGFVHRVLHMHVSEIESPDAVHIRQYLDLLPRPDVVVWVRAPLDACISRIVAKGLQSRLQRLSTEQIRRFVANAADVARIASLYLSEKNWTIVEIDNSGDRATAVADLQRKMAMHWPQRVVTG